MSLRRLQQTLRSFVPQCTALSHIWKAVVCRLLPAGLCIYIIVLAATFLFFFFFFPKGGKGNLWSVTRSSDD